MIKKMLVALTGVVVGAVVAGAAHADQLADIKQRNKLVCGTIGSVPIFSFQDAKERKTVGYDIDICHAIAKRLGVPAELKLVAGPARIPELNAGNFDIIVSTLGWTADRATQVDYSHIYFVANQQVGVREDSGVTTLAQLAGKRLAAQAASTSALAARKALPDTQLLTFDDVPQSFLAVQQNKAVGIALSELMLQSLQQRSQGQPFALRILKDSPILIEYDGIGVRKQEPALLTAVNSALKDIESTGELDRIFDKWVGKGSEFGLTRNFRVEAIPGQ